MRLSMSRTQLVERLLTRGQAALRLPGGERATLLGVEREDGSGRSFNLTVRLESGRTGRLYVRTTD